MKTREQERERSRKWKLDNPDYMKNYNQLHKEQKREYDKRYVQEHKNELREYRQRPEVKERNRNKSRKWQQEHRERVREIGRVSGQKRRDKLKIEIFHLLGNKCSNPNCLVLGGCTDVRCLQIDHVNGGGNKDKIGSESYYRKVLNRLRTGSKDYQLLCANCNWIKRYENREAIGRKRL